MWGCCSCPPVQWRSISARWAWDLWHHRSSNQPQCFGGSQSIGLCSSLFWDSSTDPRQALHWWRCWRKLPNCSGNSKNAKAQQRQKVGARPFPSTPCKKDREETGRVQKVWGVSVLAQLLPNFVDRWVCKLWNDKKESWRWRSIYSPEPKVRGSPEFWHGWERCWRNAPSCHSGEHWVQPILWSSFVSSSGRCLHIEESHHLRAALCYNCSSVSCHKSRAEEHQSLGLHPLTSSQESKKGYAGKKQSGQRTDVEEHLPKHSGVPRHSGKLPQKDGQSCRGSQVVRAEPANGEGHSWRGNQPSTHSNIPQQPGLLPHGHWQLRRSSQVGWAESTSDKDCLSRGKHPDRKSSIGQHSRPLPHEDGQLCRRTQVAWAESGNDKGHSWTGNQPSRHS